MTDSPPLAGRRIYFVGIGGAGLSAYANIATAWGAEVRGWDARETIFMEALDGIEVDLGGEPATLPGFEVVVSAAHAGRVEGRSRADFLAELVRGRGAIVVGGAHGKTTTAAMIAYVLRELGEDPAWILGGVVPQLGGNAGAGAGWLVVAGDEVGRSIARPEPEIGEPKDGVNGRRVLDNVPAGIRRGWARTLEDAARLALHWARPGDVVVTFGVGEPWKIARAIVAGLP